MPTYLTPGVYVEEVPSANKPIEGVSTSVAAFVGLTPGGPQHPDADLELDPVREDLRRSVNPDNGPFMEGAYMAHSVYGFFQNGGTNCWIVRVGEEQRRRRPPPGGASGGGGQARRDLPRPGAPQRRRHRRVELTEEPKAATEEPTNLQARRQGRQRERGVRRPDAEEGPQQPRHQGQRRLQADQDRGDRRIAARGAARPGDRQLHAVAAAPGALGHQARPLRRRRGQAPGHGRPGGHRRGDDGPDARPLAIGDDTQVRDLQGKMIAHCENMGDRMAILDAPPDLLPQEILEWRMNTAGYDSKMTALYYPWIEVMDPLTNRPINIPPSGHVAGLWCRVDETRGVHKAPANEVVMGANGLSFQVTHAEQGGLNKVGINCIRSFPGRGIRVWGARTLSSDPEWRYINVRRLFNYISESIIEGTQWSVFEPNDRFLWLQLRNAVTSFLTRTWRSGALFGNSPDAGVLRQVRRGDQPARRDRGRAGGLRGRRRAREARRVRDLPPQPVQRRRRRRSLRVALTSDEPN